MSRRRGPAPDTTTSAGEREAFRVLAPLRVTTERLVRRIHEARGGTPDERAIGADVETLFTVVLEGYRRGISTMHQGLHRAEGVDHALLDEALDFALQELHAERRSR